MAKDKNKKTPEVKKEEPSLKPALPKLKPTLLFGKGNVQIQKSTPFSPVIRRTGHKG